MFKLMVLSALFAVVFARPGFYESPLVYSAPSYAAVTIQESSLAHVGDVVRSVPSSISQHSNSVVHSHAHNVEYVLTPAVKTTSYTSQSLANPLIETYAVAGPSYHKTLAPAPVAVLQTYAASPILHKSW